jgi:hypothetical protein
MAANGRDLGAARPGWHGIADGADQRAQRRTPSSKSDPSVWLATPWDEMGDGMDQPAWLTSCPAL